MAFISNSCFAIWPSEQIVTAVSFIFLFKFASYQVQRWNSDQNLTQIIPSSFEFGLDYLDVTYENNNLSSPNSNEEGIIWVRFWSEFHLWTWYEANLNKKIKLTAVTICSDGQMAKQLYITNVFAFWFFIYVT